MYAILLRQDSVPGFQDFEDVLRTGARVDQDFQLACVRTNPREGVARPKLLAEGQGTQSSQWDQFLSKVLPLPCSAQSLVLTYYCGCIVRTQHAKMDLNTKLRPKETTIKTSK